MTFVIVGAGPTGVEMAGQISELAHRALRREYRRIDTRDARVILLDAGPGYCQPSASGWAARPSSGLPGSVSRSGPLRRRGCRQLRDHHQGRGRQTGAYRGDHQGLGGRRGREPPGGQVAEQAGAELDRAGRVLVKPDLTLPGHPEVFVIGDMISLDQLPGVAQTAIQSGRFAARRIQQRLAGEPADAPFRYRDKGSMATISRFNAVAMIGPLRLSGFIAWLLWLGVHIVYITGFKKRVTTLLHWTVSFLGSDRSERAITEQQAVAREALERVGTSWAQVTSPHGGSPRNDSSPRG